MAFEPRRTTMPRKRHKPEEIVAKLRQVDVLVSRGQSVAEAIRAIGVTEVTYYRWRREFGGLKSDQVKRSRKGRRHQPSRTPALRPPWPRRHRPPAQAFAMPPSGS